MRRIQQLLLIGQGDWIGEHPIEIAAPPDVVLSGAFHDDQPVRIDGQNSVSNALGGGVPKGPGGGALGLVPQICTDHRGVVQVALRQHDPVRDGPLLRVVGVPGDVPVALQVEMTAQAAVAVQDDAHPNLAAVLHQLVQNLQRSEALQVRVVPVVDVLRHASWSQGLVAEGDAEGVEAQLLHLGHDGLVGAHLKAARIEVRGLQAVPVHPGNADVLTLVIDDLVASGGQVSGGYIGHRRADGDGDRLGCTSWEGDRVGRGLDWYANGDRLGCGGGIWNRVESRMADWDWRGLCGGRGRGWVRLGLPSGKRMRHVSGRLSGTDGRLVDWCSCGKQCRLITFRVRFRSFSGTVVGLWGRFFRGSIRGNGSGTFRGKVNRRICRTECRPGRGDNCRSL